MVLSGSLHRTGRRIASQLRNEQLREDLWTFQDHFDIEVDSWPGVLNQTSGVKVLVSINPY